MVGILSFAFLLNNELSCCLNLLDYLIYLFLSDVDVRDFVLLDDEHAVDLLGLGSAKLGGNLDVVVDGLDFVELAYEGLEIGVALAVIVEDDEED